MNSKFLSLFPASFRDFYKNLILIVPPLVLFLFLFLFSNLSVIINSKLFSSLSLSIWLIASLTISLVAIAFIFAGLIGLSKQAIKSKANLKDFIFYSKKFWFKNLIVIIFLLILYNLVRNAAHYGALFLGKAIGLLLNPAILLFYFIYFVGLFGLIIFFTFSNFYLIVFNLTIKNSIKRSFLLVKKEYLFVLATILLFFLVNYLIDQFSLINELASDLISYLLIPFVSLIFTRFVLFFGK